MFKQGLFQHLPVLKGKSALVAALWAMGVLFIAIGLRSAEPGAAASATPVAPPAGSSWLPVQSALVSPLATPQPTVIVVAVSPPDGASDVSPEAPLTFDFSADVDRRAIERGLTLEPHIDGKFEWDGRSAAFIPDGGWEPGVTYSTSLSRGDQTLVSRWSFTVDPVIQSTTPHPHGVIGWDGVVTLTFDEPMDRASVEAAFSILPAIEGTFRWEGTSLIFAPRGEWAAGAGYTISLAPSLKTAEGKQPLRSPFRLNFSALVEQGHISFGYGPNAQVVNPDGRRAIQFEASGNLRPITVRLRALTAEQFLDRYTSSFRGVGPAEDKPIRVDDLPIVREWQHAIRRTSDTTYTDELMLPADLSPGLYVLTIDHPAAGSDGLLVMYTHHTLVLKQAEGHIATWASGIGGGPVAAMRVRIYDRDATLVAEGQTDAQGLFVTSVPIDPQPLIVVGERDGEITASGLSNEWQQGGWYGWWEPAPTANRTRVYIYTDRPIYRPGQTVHVKMAARYDNDAVYSRIPLEWDVIVRLRDARDNVVSAQTLHVNEYGTLNTSFELAEGGTVGNYHVEAQIKDETHRQAIKVEEYRKPEYEVTVHVDRSNLVNGEPVGVTVEARTYFGAPAANARVDLATYARAYDWYWYGGEDDAGRAWMPLENKLSGVTDAQGRWTAQLIPKVYLFDDYRHSAPMLIEATVDDGSGQSVSAQAQATVHDVALGLAISLSQHAYQPGQAIPVSVFARDLDGRPRAGEMVSAEILGWSYDSGYTRVMADAEGRTGQDGGVILNLTVAEQGWYELRVSGADHYGSRTTRADWVWVYDPSHQSLWYLGDSSELRISADRPAYAPGDTAQLLIRTPVSGPALLTFERGKTRRAQVIELTAPTTIVPVTIQDDDAPNVHVAVNVYRPVDLNADHWQWQSIPEADLLVARTNLSVPADNRRLTIAVTPDQAVYGPREEATFDIQVTGADGAPAQAEMSLALVDESIYALSEELAADPFEAFYAERADIVRTYDSLRPVRYLGGGMGGGGGGGDVLANPRWNFPDTAYWNATIVTGADGRATVRVPLPDSLTRWRAVVRAVTADEFPRVGEAVASITTTQPIVVRPALPRQLVQGDQLLLSAVVHNNTDQAREAQVWIEAIGLEIGTQMNTDDGLRQTVMISPNGSVVVGWPVSASALGTVTVTLRVRSGDAADAVRMALPVAPLAVPDVKSAVGEVETSVEEIVDLPPGTIGEASSIQIDLSPSIAASVLDGLAYLTGYPFGCVEQTMSKALPNAVVGRAFAALSLGGDARLPANLPRQVNAGLQRLYGFQHNDGGWGWWFDDSSDDYQTAYVLFGLAMTRQAAYIVDDGVIERGATYLKTRLPSIGDARTQAYALFALALAGQGELSAAQQLADAHLDAHGPLRSASGVFEDARPQLDSFSQAALAIALHELGDEPRARLLIDALAGEAIVSDGAAYWDTGSEDGHYHQKTMSSSIRSTALALDALVRIRPDDPLVTRSVRWLMARRAATGWGTTQETAYAVVALTDYLRSTNELVAGSAYRVFVNDALVGEGALSAGQLQLTLSVPATQLRVGQNRVRIERSGAANKLYYKITRRAMIAGSTDEAAGPIQITRAYLDPKTNRPIDVVRVGDVVKVQLSVTLPDASWYVAVEDPLPGGLEGLNERLNTTSYAARLGYYEEGAEFFYQEYGYNNKEVRDDRVVFFVTQLGEGQHTFTYLARATQAGTFSALPAQAYLMYEPEIWGRSASGAVSVSPNG